MLYTLLLSMYLIFPVIGFVQMQANRTVSIELSADATLRAKHYQQGKRLLIWGLLAGGFAMVSVVPLMGLPGGVVLSVGQFFGLGSELLKGDKAWPAAIFASLIFPLGIPLGLLFKNVIENNGWQRLATFSVPIVLIIWGFATIMILIIMDNIGKK
jgi:hypothetical protein